MIKEFAGDGIISKGDISPETAMYNHLLDRLGEVWCSFDRGNPDV